MRLALVSTGSLSERASWLNFAEPLKVQLCLVYGIVMLLIITFSGDDLQEAALMHGKQELSRAKAALEDVLGAKAVAQQELRIAQQGAASAASQAAAAQEALKDATAVLCKVATRVARFSSRQKSCALVMRL